MSLGAHMLARKRMLEQELKSVVDEYQKKVADFEGEMCAWRCSIVAGTQFYLPLLVQKHKY